MNNINITEQNGFFENFNFIKPLNVIIKQKTESTNTDAKLLAEQGNTDSLVIALEQTSGKGRLDRKFFSPVNTGIYMSLLLRPNIEDKDVTFLTSLAAVAVAKAIEKRTSKKAYIKWVNDIYINDKKVCGILCGSSFCSNGKLNYAIIGIGINLNTPKEGFPNDIKDIATSIFDNNVVTAKERTKLIECIVDEILNGLNNGIKAHLKEYKERSYLNGKTVSFFKEGKNISATVKGIDDNCNLILETKNGETISLCAGEVSVKQG